jgi:hypothetical protein
MEIILNYFTSYKKEVFFVGIVIMTASLSFGFGYVTSGQFNHASIFIEKCSSNRGS